MRCTGILGRWARSWPATLALLAGAGVVHGADSFDASTGRLTVPALTIGGATFSNVVVVVGNVLQGPSGEKPAGSVDTFDPASGRLTVPAVALGGTTYYNVVATVKTLVSVGGLIGGDSYDGVHLTIPSVRLGAAVYDDVVITIAAIVSPGGGLPRNSLDQYDPSTGQLTVAAAMDAVHGRVYTNAIVKVGRVVSVGGTGTSPTLVTEHALAQTGLAIGLASTVLQSQLLVVSGLGNGLSTCSTLNGGGSVESGSTPTAVTVYYDNACTKPYVVADGILAQTATVATIAETAAYYGLSGALLGNLTLNEALESVLDAGGTTTAVNVHGLGIFTPAAGVRTPVQLGLYCTIPSNILTAASTLPCAGGIAQDFPALGIAIGAVTPLTLYLQPLNSGGPLTFVGSGSTIDEGPLGSLTLTAPGALSMAVTGGTQSPASFSASGRAASFALFPPTPTSWTLTDPVTGLLLQVTVASNTVRNLTLSITQPSTGTTLATGAIDQSGSGTMTWSDGSVEQITSWTLGGVAP